jgi:hypothetical protein
MYKGTIYIGGEGGHISVAKVEIDPSDTETPIKLASSLSRITINPASISPIHDVRVDANDKTKLYWSAILPDGDGKIHYGTVDLTTNKKVEDKTVDKDATYTGGPMFCGSGQSADKFLPVFMGYEGFVEIFDKNTLESEGRVFFTGDDFDPNYVFMHGRNTPDLSKFLLISNGATTAGDTSTMNGKIHLYMMEMDSLITGEPAVSKYNVITGNAGTTIGFRQSFTPDGKYLLQAGRDNFYLVDADTLETLDAESMDAIGPGYENHDAISTPDGKYAVLSLRTPYVAPGTEQSIMDGQIQLYDIANKKVVGNPTSVCRTCHDSIGVSTDTLESKGANLCGLDVVWEGSAPGYQ